MQIKPKPFVYQSTKAHIKVLIMIRNLLDTQSVYRVTI